MRCDFKPGDEIVCVNDGPIDGRLGWQANIRAGEIYTVSAVGIVPPPHPQWGMVTVHLVGVSHVCRTHGIEVGYRADRFRKVERRNDSLSIEAFLTIKPGQFEEPRKAPAKKREKV